MRELILILLLFHHSPAVVCGDCWKVNRYGSVEFKSAGSTWFAMPKNGCVPPFFPDEIFPDYCKVTVIFPPGVECEKKSGGDYETEMICHYHKESK